MDMQFTVVAEDTCRSGSLQISISGSRLEFVGFFQGKKVAIEEESGRITFRIITFKESAQPAAVEVQPVVEVQPGAVSEAVSEAAQQEQSLFQKLAALRKQIAAESRLPPYIIFHDKALKDMCSILPADMDSLKGISGVGQSKLEKYGSRFIEVIRQHIGVDGGVL